MPACALWSCTPDCAAPIGASAAVLGVSPATLYHWLARFDHQPLQVAALFGLVRSSGVISIDEKNATERLIRRFDQHYQNFAGFDSLDTARCYLYIFVLTCRFTPFDHQVQPHLHGKRPRELAGYDLSNVPLARYLREHSLIPLVPSQSELVPR